jgi:tRNA threonylcarbamoyl adenosine modification protein YeaZ
MSILAVDTASRHRALCVLATENGSLLAQRPLTGRDLGRELPPALAALLDGGVVAVACVVGPGSYTGLRVGIAAALGVAHARGLPLHGIAALDVVALAAPPDAGEIEAVADAGRGALYLARHRRDGTAVRIVDGPRHIDAADWTPAPGAYAVSLDGVPGTQDVSGQAAVALAAAAANALQTPPLPLAGLEPVYLTSSPARARRPRV